ncbi:hypothetical protein KIPB_002643 [Kipferlia bialata]|uniref:Uncharacterized protein n=1 Tax=Kipferlia bialata TaxID=797122 RepID=A0A9K3CSK8_9EUKA|nr:hypothetical protein KIPB_002643 [Kipferlia bialata]|eukprot:g2643.t1
MPGLDLHHINSTIDVSHAAPSEKGDRAHGKSVGTRDAPSLGIDPLSHVRSGLGESLWAGRYSSLSDLLEALDSHTGLVWDTATATPTVPVARERPTRLGLPPVHGYEADMDRMRRRRRHLNARRQAEIGGRRETEDTPRFQRYVPMGHGTRVGPITICCGGCIGCALEVEVDAEGMYSLGPFSTKGTRTLDTHSDRCPFQNGCSSILARGHRVHGLPRAGWLLIGSVGPVTVWGEADPERVHLVRLTSDPYAKTDVAPTYNTVTLPVCDYTGDCWHGVCEAGVAVDSGLMYIPVSAGEWPDCYAGVVCISQETLECNQMGSAVYGHHPSSIFVLDGDLYMISRVAVDENSDRFMCHRLCTQYHRWVDVSIPMALSNESATLQCIPPVVSVLEGVAYLLRGNYLHTYSRDRGWQSERVRGPSASGHSRTEVVGRRLVRMASSLSGTTMHVYDTVSGDTYSRELLPRIRCPTVVGCEGGVLIVSGGTTREVSRSVRSRAPTSLYRFDLTDIIQTIYM